MNDPIGAEPRGISSKTYKMSGTTGQSPGVFTQIGINLWFICIIVARYLEERMIQTRKDSKPIKWGDWEHVEDEQEKIYLLGDEPECKLLFLHFFLLEHDRCQAPEQEVNKRSSKGDYRKLERTCTAHMRNISWHKKDERKIDQF